MKGKSGYCPYFSGRWSGVGIVCLVLFLNLFMYWGFVYGTTGLLGSYFQQAVIQTKVGNGLIQVIVYSAYFLMTIPVENYIRKHGYRSGMIGGIACFVAGIMAMVPVLHFHSSVLFYITLFITACGLGILGTVANIYTILMEAANTDIPQLQQSLSLNYLGWIAGPLISSVFLFNGDSSSRFDQEDMYGLTGGLVLVIFLTCLFLRLPKVKLRESTAAPATSYFVSKHSCCIRILLALLLYFVAQSGLFSFFIRYASEATPTISYTEALKMMLFGSTVLFVLGRLFSFVALKGLKSTLLLIILATGGIICMLLLMSGIKVISLCMLFLTFFFLSTICPLILAVGMEQMGTCMKWISPLFMVGIAGSALSPILMEFVWKSDIATGFVVPLIAFLYILYFAVYAMKKKRTTV